ncbi:MAG: flagellar biosynthesis anti-sigma factor FlgM [Lachnospiraceae bacterium]|nr:flagellar biosynthesis anti-sigma factor FlgM [Lachnospiraceae bacterium]
MRIEAYNQVSSLYQAKSIKRPASAANTAYVSDRVQISSLGKDFQTAKAAVAQASDIREDITAPIKEKINNGTYSVDTGSFAEKLLAKYEELR